MYQIYSLLLTLGFIVLLPRFLFDAFRHGKYVAGFRERLGSIASPSTNQPVIWLHCVSVGETQAARPLADLIRRDYPNHSLVVSTITLTGQTLARQVFEGKAAKVFYFPFDWRWSVRRALRAIKPSAVLLMETELWPNFLRECSRQHVPVALVNGRISDKSLRRYRIVRNFFRRVIRTLDLAVMQSEHDAARLQELGYAPEKLFVSGSLKFDAGTAGVSMDLTERLRQRFNLSDAGNLLLAASTHAPEERIILESLKLVREKSAAGFRLIIAPRHPERFGEVAALLRSSGLRWKRRTEAENGLDKRAEVILLDTIGELPAAYSLATIVFVGGSIANTGGHNVLEPAAAGRCIVTGPHTHNFATIVDAFVNANALVKLPRLSEREMVQELARTLDELVRDPGKRVELGKRAEILLEQNVGAAERTMQLIEPLLAESTRNIDG
jgi:3-deoxy-D-manno-octulosonic-acid transferase